MPIRFGSAVRHAPVAPADPDQPRDVTWDILSGQLNDLVLMADASGVIFYVSPACRSLGYTQLEMIGRGAADFVHPGDLDRFLANTAGLFAPAPAGPVPNREHRVRRKDGSWVWMEGSPNLMRDGEGAPIGIINVFRDVTTRREAEQALEENERRFRLLTEHATDMISQTSAEGRFVYLSPSVQRVTGYTVEELLPRTMRDFVHSEDLERCLAFYGELVSGRSGGGGAIRYRIAHKDGRWLWVESNPRLVPGAGGEPANIVDVTRDVSEQQALKIKLEAALAEAERLAAVKTEFLANMSHEIRTPLTAMLGFTSLLGERRDLDPVAQTQVARVAAAGRSLLAIVNDVLDFSKLEAGRVSLNPRPTPPAVAASEVVELFEAEAASKGLMLSFQAAATVPTAVRLDADRLRQILVNLVGNAVKFTEHGSVHVSVGYRAADSLLVVDVADTGPGIAAAAREKLFRRFSQVDGSSTRTKGGTGLGLAISRKLAEAMGGDIALKSRVGRGSIFRLELPAPVTQELPAQVDGVGTAQVLDGLRVLVVDDNAINRELARAILEPAGVEVSEAADGLEALEAARRLPVDLILMDQRMPRMNGREAATAIRLTPGPNQDIPMLAFSADSEVAGDPAALAPFDGHVSKPVSPAALIGALVTAMGVTFEPAKEGIAHVAG